MTALFSSQQADATPKLWIPVSGTSMWPALRAGDLAGVEPLDRPLCRGEVVVVRTEAQLIAHRVASTSRDGLVLKGDTCVRADPPVSQERVLGRVVRVRRGGRVLEQPEWDRPLGWLGAVLIRAAQRRRKA